MDLRDLYQDIILDHGQRPRNFRAQEHPSHVAHGHNPLCGDKVTVYLTVDGERILRVSAVFARNSGEPPGGRPAESAHVRRD